MAHVAQNSDYSNTSGRAEYIQIIPVYTKSHGACIKESDTIFNICSGFKRLPLQPMGLSVWWEGPPMTVVL